MTAFPEPSSGWLALSDTGMLAKTPANGLLHKGKFVLELAMPLAKTAVLLAHHCNLDWPRTFTLLFDPKIGFIIAHRQGARVVRHVLPGPIRQGQGHGRLTFDFDAPAKRWSLRFEHLSAAPAFVTSSHGTDPLPLQIADIAALCAQPFACSPPVLWFGVSHDYDCALPAAAPWIGLRTKVDTSLGPIAAGNLRPGDIIMTLDQGPQMLLACQQLSLPARGSFAPVLLCAPYFGQQQDILVSADQLIAIEGPETEYLFDQDSVLVPAAGLVDGRTALFDDRRAVTQGVALCLGTAALIVADGCVFGLGPDAALDLPLPCLRPYEVLTLMSLLGRTPRRVVQSK